MENNSIIRLADFVSGTNFEDLPAEAVTFLKRHLLDTFGCAIAGVTSDKGKYGINFARTFHAGPAQATVLGYGDRLSAMGAAFVNAELINGLDYDAAGLHLPPFVIPPALAAAQMNHRSGKDLITAVALALEVGTRMAKGLIPVKLPGAGINKVSGPSSSVFGGAAGVSKMEGFTRDQTAHALGLVGVMSTVNSQSAMHQDLPINSGKYLMAGWAAQTGLTAPYLIKSGHRGDLKVLDNKIGYYLFSGWGEWRPDIVFDGIGEDWRFLTITPYKQFPTCGMMSGGLEIVTDLVKENGIRPEEIEQIHTYLDPSSAEPMFHNRTIYNQTDMQFSVPYNMAVCAYGIAPGVQWQNRQNLDNPLIRSLMDKVVMDVHPECAEAQKIDNRNRVIAVEITARGQVFRKELRFVKGTVTTGSVMHISDEELIAKFRSNAEVLLPDYKIEQAVETMYRLDEMEDINDVVKLFHV